MTLLIIALLECYTLIVGFLCYAAIQPVWSNIPAWGKVILAPLLVFYPIDIIVRCTVFTVLFMELPTLRTLTVTALCNSHCNDVDGYRRAWGRAICGTLNIINPKHCEGMM
jgi:hypothetical protein